MERFKPILLEQVKEFLSSLEEPDREKIIYNIRKSQIVVDPELFEKLDQDIWEFRTKYRRKYYRLLAFWDKRDNKNTLVICTHGFIKKTKKTPKKEIEKARKIMIDYFNQKKSDKNGK